MGSEISSEERARREERSRDYLQRQVSQFKRYADLSVDRSIQMFCSTSSSDHLQQHLNRQKLKYPAADWLKKLAEKLAGLCSDPKLAGLGALAIAMFIDIIAANSSSSSSSEPIKDALRSVFAEEKASEVWVQIDECLKRCMVNMSDHHELVRDLRRIESNLSEAVTRLKNSMVSGGHMSADALKAWVNGAVFHVQMMLHLVRLGGVSSNSPVETLISTYQSDLALLFEKHEKKVRSQWGVCVVDGIEPFEPDVPSLYETEMGERRMVDSCFGMDTYFQAYYEKNYGRQRTAIRDYLNKVDHDLSELSRQNGYLNIY